MSSGSLSAADLRAGRVAAGMTQAQAGERIGVSANTIERWERGVHAPQPQSLAAAIDAYGLEVEGELSDTVGRVLLERIDRLETVLLEVRDELAALRSERDTRHDTLPS